MEIIVIDGGKCRDKTSTHEYLADTMDLPEYYGKNLDALYDVLTSITEDVCFQIINSFEIVENLGLYGTKMIKVFTDAANVNQYIKTGLL